jgi:predicted ester cyclase
MRAFDQILADDYVNHNIPVPGVPVTKGGFREIIQATRKAFPDVHVQVKDVVSEGDSRPPA